MNLLAEITARFRTALTAMGIENPGPLLEMIRPAADAKFGDYQANFAMPLGKQLGKPPREVAELVKSKLKIDDLCEEPTIAGPGFINLKLTDEALARLAKEAVADERIGVPLATNRKTYVVDYSAPNVAKPMHVGHIRSTVIGDSLYRTLKFLGHTAIGDNHIGDWGTQFGMIIYGFKHFADQQDYAEEPVTELSRLYKLVRKLMDYHESKRSLPLAQQKAKQRDEALALHKQTPKPADKEGAKKYDKELAKLQAQAKTAHEELSELRDKVERFESDEPLMDLASRHPGVEAAVLEETVKLHQGDVENLRLWKEFLPKCEVDIERLYQRLKVKFDHTYGESFYHDMLAGVVKDFEAKQLARESEGATCVFLDGFDTPMIIRKRDGAFLYSTTDLATIKYRAETWKPSAILYVVDHRQGGHFDKLFAAAKLWGYGAIELKHVSFGTVLGDDGRPFKTRAGDTVGLESLLDESVQRALKVVSENDDGKKDGPELSSEDRQRIAEIVGIAAIKYADLSQNRDTDYTFSYDKMLALNGNTATYMQYGYARVRSIFAKGGVDAARLQASGAKIDAKEPAERALLLEILRFAESLDAVLVDYRPNQLTSYLFSVGEKFASFYNDCPVLKAEDPAVRNSRLLLCDLTARTLKQGLELLGIEVVEKM